MRKSLIAAAIASALAAPSFADEVVFNNGDHLTGKIESMEGGKMIIKSAIAGKVTVEMKNVRTFSSDGALSIRLNDGTVVKEKVNTAAAGTVAVAPGGAIAAQDLPLAKIQDVNFSEKWTGTLAVGGALSRGNTESETLSIAAHAVRRTDSDRILFDAGFLYGRERFSLGTDANGVGVSKVSETQNDWFLGGKYDLLFTKRFYGYFNARVERDTIAGISLRVTPGVGVGYSWIDNPNTHFTTDAGISWLYRDYTDGTPQADTVAARLAYHIDHKFNDKVSIFHNVEYFPGLDSINDYYFDADAGVRTVLTDKMFAEFKVQEQYDARPAHSRGKNDTQFLVGVGWEF